MERTIREKLTEIEKRENIRVLYAVESGSRAWGFASSDSDYDVRFVYIRPRDWYLKLEQKKDFIEWELNETLDINGWDITKFLQQIHRSNATAFEWMGSPIRYRETEDWRRVRELSTGYFARKPALYHYYGTANKNYFEYLTGEQVRYKKYFYVLRPLLACRWIEERNCPPPVLFSDLEQTVLPAELKETVSELLEAKKRMSEAETGPRVDSLNRYITGELDRLKKLTDSLPVEENSGWGPLNDLFLEILKETAL